MSSPKTPISATHLNAFRKKVLDYYAKNKRDFPWRQTTDPYHILISEIMLQQTQAQRVVSYYTRWIQQWRTIHQLARASRINILKEWSGLGYNKRALHLHITAQQIVELFKGDVLKAITTTKLPGIGPYTANAVRIFSANEDRVTVDTNIRRIFIHEFKLDNPLDGMIQKLAEQCLPKGKSREWHNALMDYGAMLITAKKTGIKPKTQQSIFAGSDRQLRGKLLRLLLKQEQTAVQCCKVLKTDDKSRIIRILQMMVKNNLLVKKRNMYYISE